MERFSWTLAVDCVRLQPNDRLGASISAQQKRRYSNDKMRTREVPRRVTVKCGTRQTFDL